VEPEHFRFGGGATETLLHPLAAVWMLIAAVLILTLPRNKAIVPLLLSFFTLPIGQVVLLGSLHFTVLRILILVGLARRAFSQRSSSAGMFPGSFNTLDRLVILWSLSTAIVFSLEWMETQAFISRLGDLVDGLGGYLVVRYLIPDGEAVRRTIKVFAVICLIQGACMINEQISHINVFGLLGGIPAGVAYRNGHIRSQGALGNINAGVFGGVLIPLFLWLWIKGKSRLIAGVGIAGATAMVLTCDSSTGVMAYGAGLLAVGLWPLRKRMRLVRWVVALTLVSLHLVMKAPVWALIARVDLTGSSTGYHRYMLLDNCIRHFSQWWFLGYKNYNEWGTLMFDMCNQYVYVAVMGGLVSLVLYIAILSRGFGAIGTARKQVSGDRGREWFLWCLGSTLFAHLAAGFGISYLAQLQVALFAVLGSICVAAFETQEATVQSVQRKAEEELAAAPA
jgi:hypothetical protein